MVPPFRTNFQHSSFTLSDCSYLYSTTSRDDSLNTLVRSTNVPYTIPNSASPPSPVAIIPPTKLKQSTGKKLHATKSQQKASGPSFRPSARPKKVRSSKSNIPGASRYWTPSEHKLFVKALLKYGPKDLKSISKYVGTRNLVQCRTHEQKCFMRLMKEAHRETMQRNGMDPDAMVDVNGKKVKPQKEIYSVSPSCGISLLCVVSEEMTRALQA